MAGRPTKFKKIFIKKVDEYLEECQDEEIERVKQENAEKGYQMLEHRLKVKLPTIEGFARFIGVNKTSLYEWEKNHEEFSNSLEKIKTEQKERLMNSGLSGDYNPTIAKLILSSNHDMHEKSELSGNPNSPLVVIAPQAVIDSFKLNGTDPKTRGSDKGQEPI
ncbi:MAG: terminase small subunit [Patescibacteria group bacterium]